MNADIDYALDYDDLRDESDYDLTTRLWKSGRMLAGTDKLPSVAFIAYVHEITTEMLRRHGTSVPVDEQSLIEVPY